MARALLLGFLSSTCLAVASYASWLTWFSGEGRALEASCASWLEQPRPRWLALRGCLLEVDELVLESAEGDFEPLSNRRQGLSARPYAQPPVWVAAWAPVAAPGLRGRVVKAAFRVDGRDVVDWLNAFERADDATRDRLWADPVLLRRVSSPGVLEGIARRPGSDALQKAFGKRASALLLAVDPGQPRPPSLPAWGVAALLGGLGFAWAAWRRFSDRAALPPESVEQALTGVDVRGVGVQLGELERLREEERRARRGG